MTTDWEGNIGREVEAITLRCIAGNLPASTWHKIIRQTIQGKIWDHGSQSHLAATLISCLNSNHATAPLVTQYIIACSQKDNLAQQTASTTCEVVAFCEVLLDDVPTLRMAKQTLQDLCAILDRDDPFHSFFTIRRCTAAAILLQIGIQDQSDPITSLANRLLSSFEIPLQQLVLIDEAEREGCLAAIQAINKEKHGLNLGMLNRIHSNLRKRTRNVDRNDVIGDSEKGPDRWEQSDGRNRFRKLLPGLAKEAPHWDDHPRDESAIAILPEVANLLHFLVDEYSSWQGKVDATRMVLLARLRDNAAMIDQTYERFYLELFNGAANACAAIAGTPATLGGDEAYSGVWRSALCGLMPSIVEILEKDRIQDAKEGTSSTRDCMAKVVKSLFSSSNHAMTGCEVILASPDDKKKTQGTVSAAEDDTDMILDVFIGNDDEPARQPIRAAFLRSLEEKNLLQREDWTHEALMKSVVDDWYLLSDTFVSEVGGGIIGDASFASHSTGLEAFLESRLNSELVDDAKLWTRFVDDYACQETFARMIVKFSLECISTNELDSLSKLCKTLMTDPTTLDILLLYVCPSQLLQPIAGLLDDSDLFSNGEEPSVIGGMLLFAQLLVHKGQEANYSIDDLLPSTQYQFLPSFVRSSTSIQVYSQLAAKEQEIVSNWVTALFGSEGISDDLIKSSSPQTLLRMSPTLFSQSITACLHEVIDLDTLRGGLTYFLQDLLIYALPSALTWLLGDLSRIHGEESLSLLQDAASKGRFVKAKMVRLEVLSTLLSSESCPCSVKRLVANRASEVLKACDNGEYPYEVKVLQSAMAGQAESRQTQKTHLWIKMSQAAMTKCPLDSLLNLDTSLSAIWSKRGTKAALQIILDSFLRHPRSKALARAVAMSISIATVEKKDDSCLADQVVIEFTRQVLSARYSGQSPIEALDLTLQMLQSYRSAIPTKAAFISHLTDSMQAIIALQIQRVLTKAKSDKDVEQAVAMYGILFQSLPRRTILSQLLSS